MCGLTVDMLGGSTWELGLSLPPGRLGDGWKDRAVAPEGSIRAQGWYLWIHQFRIVAVGTGAKVVHPIPIQAVRKALEGPLRTCLKTTEPFWCSTGSPGAGRSAWVTWASGHRGPGRFGHIPRSPKRTDDGHRSSGLGTPQHALHAPHTRCKGPVTAVRSAARSQSQQEVRGNSSPTIPGM